MFVEKMHWLIDHYVLFRWFYYAAWLFMLGVYICLDEGTVNNTMMRIKWYTILLTISIWSSFFNSKKFL